MIRRQSDPNQGTSIVRFRFALAVMVAGMLFAAGIASAQSTTQTSTDDLSGYSKTTTTKTQAVSPTATTAPATEGQEENSVAPSVAAQSAPSNLAFTGGEPLLLIALGLALCGGTATLLVRDRRRSSQNR
jgi:carbohydrate-binding DOMON domain-containing protein